MSTKLYYESPYIKDWETKITKVIEKDWEYFVTLEETAFYPHGGGQPCDKGSINGIAVLDVYKEGYEVIHKLERLPDTSNATCKVDWNTRFDHMQHHSGQHLLSAICLEHLQARTISFHLGTEDVTIDVDQSALTAQQLSELEQEVNKQIYQNRQIHSYFVTQEQLMKIPVVKMPKVTENIRIVEIEGIEYNACGGTHVSRTGEIGMIKLLKAEKIKGGTKIHFKCGYRALKDFNESLHVLSTLATKFNTGQSEILNRFEKWEQDQKELQSQMEVFKQQNDSYLAKELLSEMEGNVIKHIFEDKSLKDMQHLAATLAEEHHLIILFMSNSENKVVFAHHGRQRISCGEFFKEHLGKYNGKGGGRDQSAQAGFPTADDALAFFSFTSEQLKLNNEDARKE